MRYTLVKGTHGRFENGAFVQYGLNSTIELTDAEAEALKGRIALASSGVQGGAQTEHLDSTTDDSDWTFIDTLHHSKVIELLNGLDDAEQVQSALDYELAHKNRPSVTMAARERIAALDRGQADEG